MLVLRGEPGIGKTALLEYAGRSARRYAGAALRRDRGRARAAVRRHAPARAPVPRSPRPAARTPGRRAARRAGAELRRRPGPLPGLARACSACSPRRATTARCSAASTTRSGWTAVGRGARVRRAALPGRADRAAHGRARRRRAPSSTRPASPSSSSAASTRPHAHALLSARLGRRWRPTSSSASLQTAHGNPLALLELPAALSDAQLDGVEPIVGPPPVRGAVEAAFGARVAELPDAARRVLLLAAADDAGDLVTVQRAAEALGLALEDLDAAERAGLVRVDGGVAFRHPLVRSAVYRAATRSERRAAHEALAAAVDDPVSGAWHRAVVADRADERARRRARAGGPQAIARTAHATAAVTFERAAELSEAEPAPGPAPARRRPGGARRRAPRCRAGARGACAPAHRRPGRRGAARSHPRHGGRPPGLARGGLGDARAMPPPSSHDAAPELATELALWSLFSGLQGGWDERLFTEGQSAIARIESDGPLGASRTTSSTACRPTSPATPRRPEHASRRRFETGASLGRRCGRWPCRSSCGR